MRRVFIVSDNRAILWMVAAVAAALLLLEASVAPAFAQDNINIGDDIEYNGVCQNIIGAIGDITQSQTGSAVAIHRERRDTSDAGAASTAEANAASTATADATATAEADATATAQAEETADASADAAVAEPTAGAVAQVAQEQGVSIAQVNECLNGAANNNPPENGTTDNGTTNNTGGEIGALTITPHGKVLTASIPEQKVLADTGGTPLFVLAIIGLGLVGAGAALLRFGGWR